VFHPAGIVFKGSGFYATDNRSKSTAGSSESKNEPKPETKADSKGDSKGDTKPAAGEKATTGSAQEKTA
jgi:hypothetical protein